MTTNGAAVTKTTRYEYYLKDPKANDPIFKTRIDYADGSKSFKWPTGTKMQDVGMYRQGDLTDAFGDDPILLVEGEKTADALNDRGIVAVSLPGGSGQRDLSALDVLKAWPDSTIYVSPDNDAVGLKAATAWYEHLKRIHPKVRWVPPVVEAPGGDFADLLSDFATDDDAEARFEIATRLDAALDGPPGPTPAEVPKKQADPWEDFNDLADEPEEEMVSFGLFSEGTWIVAGAPKLGKSWFCLSYAHGLSIGGAVLGSIQVEPCDVLALILEDGRRRYKKRIKERVESLPRPDRGRYLIRFKWPRLDQESLDRLEADIQLRTAAGRKVCVVIDTGTKLRPLDEKNSSIYMGDYNFLDPLTEVAQRNHCLIMVVAHTRKAPSVDFIDSVIGSHGISGAVDGIAVLSRERHSKQATLEITGRDGDEQKHYLQWDPIANGWLLTEEPDQATEKRRAVQFMVDRIKGVLAENDKPMGLLAIRMALGADKNAVKDAAEYAVETEQILATGKGVKNDPVLYSLPIPDGG